MERSAIAVAGREHSNKALPVLPQQENKQDILLSIYSTCVCDVGSRSMDNAGVYMMQVHRVGAVTETGWIIYEELELMLSTWAYLRCGRWYCV